MNPPLYADIALAVPSQGTFQYSVPESFRGSIEPGMRVFVSVRNRRMVGYVVGLSSEKAFDELRDLDGVIDPSPIVSPAMLELTRWMSQTYWCSWGQALDSAMPAPFKKGKFLMKSRSKKAVSELVNPDPLPLTEHQRAAHERVLQTLRGRRHETFLLHGITGSGKTEIYMQLIRDLLEDSRGSIVLVPEISLTPQTVDRFSSRFGDCVAVIHSRLSQARRVEEWHRIRSGEAKVVVGARSAVFSPVKNLGLVVIDEEHDTSYKQEETPRYHTRGVAARRCQLENAVLLLGSATPSLESTYACENGAAVRLALPERIENRPLPEVRIVDQRLQEAKKGPRIFSGVLETAVKETLAKKEQVMLLLNRRGFSTYLHCASCGYVMTCENCRTTLAYHYDKASLYCHVCGFRSSPLRVCPGCRKSYLHYFGMGTQKVEGEAMRLFPGARIGRMDADSTSKKDSHETILRAFRKKEIDILIGTQMIAKGHDFPNVSLIGVVSADTALHIPDFRAAERTFDLLTQVAGRAGRGDVPGRVIVQTYVPHHYSIVSAKDHDYQEFYSKEILYRRELRMPPFSRLLKVVFSGVSEKEVVKQILGFVKHLEPRLDKSRLSVLGPSPSLTSKQKGVYLWNFYLKGPTLEELSPVLASALADFKKARVQITVDADPQ